MSLTQTPAMTKLTSYPTDCLVLRIDEMDVDTKKLDITMYVLYDSNNETFVVRGKRENEWITHSYYCESLKDLSSFLSTVICKQNLWSYTLYTMENLADNSDDISFGTLDRKATKETEFCGYDSLPYSRKTLRKMLNILRNVYNYY
jgi:hypothetical protein